MTTRETQPRRGDKTGVLILRVTPEMLAALDEIAAERGGEQSRASVARELIAAALKGRKKR